MKFMLTVITGLLLAAAALGGDVYVVTDAQGNRVYTDRPQTLPAERTGIHSNQTDPAKVQARLADEMKQFNADAEAATSQNTKGSDAGNQKDAAAGDRDQRCADARKRYEVLMFKHRIYEIGPDGERRYLDSAEIDAARADAEKAMDEFCGGQ
jgi:hypothetical protein